MHLRFGSEMPILKALLLLLYSQYRIRGVEILRLRALMPLFLKKLENEHARAFLGEISLEEGDKFLDEIILSMATEGFARKSEFTLSLMFNQEQARELLRTIQSSSELQGLEDAGKVFYDSYVRTSTGTLVPNAA